MPAVRAAEPFVVMAKPVGAGCNVRCSYCYYTDGGRLCFGEGPMADDLLERFIRQTIQASPGPAVSFTWHGGEPTLAGLPFYRKAVAHQKKYLPEGWACWNNLQTNGLLLTEEWCAFLAEEKFDVGLSVDGTQQIHDRHRRDRAGEATYRRAALAAQRLLAHGIRADLLCAVTSEAAKEPLAVYRALRELRTGWIQFLPIVRLDDHGDPTPESVSPQAYGKFLCDVLDEWLLHDIGTLSVQLFAEMMLVWSGKSANLCTMAPTCGRVLIVERQGDVYSCDHFVRPSHRIGSILTDHLGTLADLKAQRDFGERKRDALPGTCLACRHLAVCNGGCPKDRAAIAGEAQPLHRLCEGLLRFFDYAKPPLLHLLALRKKGVSSGDAVAEFRAVASARWKGVGRNDPCPCGSGRKAKACCWQRFH